MANDRDPRSDLGAWLGEELHRVRLAAGYKSQEQLARKLGWERSVIAKAETGDRPPSSDVADALVALFPSLAGGRFAELAEVARKANGTVPRWFADWLDMEKIAAVIHWWEPLLVPGLLQTPDYARAVLGWGPDNGSNLDDRVADRLERQHIFDRERPPEVWMLIGESVLDYCVGSADVMRKQVDHLCDMSQRPRVTIQVVPASARAYGGLSGAFAIGTDEAHDTVVYLETGVQGMIVRDPKLIDRAASMFGHLRAEAIPRSQTLEFLAKAGERWNA
jgi:transcriptional regulator with XRE-family HTH domain